VVRLNVHDSTLSLPASVVAIGAFDGVHRGHQKLIGNALKHARETGVPLVVYTFDPPPKVYFQKSLLLTSLDEKLERLKALGADHIIVQSFNEQYRARKAEEFHQDLRKLNPIGIWVGTDFKYGADRLGDICTLRRHFSVRTVEPICCENGKVISSSRIRLLIQENNEALANQLLGW